MRPIPTLSAVLLTLSLAGATAAQAAYRPIPGAISANDITPDGNIVVGGLLAGGAYRWDMVNDPAPVDIGGWYAAAVSDDGSVIVGNMDDPDTGAQVAGRWTEATGWVSLGGLGSTCGSISSAYDVSADGNVVVGLGWLGCSGAGFRWTNGVGMEPLEHLVNGNNRASTVSGDGSFVGGFCQGSFNRSPAIWFPDTSGLAFNPDIEGEVHGSNADGSVYLGTVYVGGPAYSAFYNVGGTNVMLGSLNEGWGGNARDISEDGGRIVGFDVLLGGTEAWIWSEATGIERLSDKLNDLGLDVPFLGACRSVSDDGTKIVGNNGLSGWLAVLPRSEVETYGCTNPAESLTVLSGTPAIGATLTLGIDDPSAAATNPSTGVLLLSLGADPNFPCGTSVPGFGELLVSLPWFTTLIAPQPWTGTPTALDLPIPSNPDFLGLEVYAQGVLTDSVNNVLTEGLKLTLGTD